MRLTLTSLFIYFLFGCSSNNTKSSGDNLETAGSTIDYLAQSVKILPDGSFIEGPEAIKAYNLENPLSIDSLKKNYSVKANDRFIYEISSFESADIPYKQITIIEPNNENRRAFEFIAQAEASSSQKIKEQIQLRRDEWIERCNKHDARDLVTQMYLIDAIYFSHKPVIANRDSLIKEYDYMNNPKYSLHLDPLHVETVTSDLAFEIGRCSGSYNGKYIIVWKKDERAGWGVMIDSNI